MKDKNYTQADIDEFDKLCDQMDSHNQVERISGRLDFSKFKERFTEAELNEMFELIKDKYKR